MDRLPPVRIDFWFDEGCPNTSVVRDRVRRSLAAYAAESTFHEHPDQGRLSPTVTVDGRDVLGARSPARGCRLDLPTSDDIDRALRHAGRRSLDPVAPGLGPVGRAARAVLGTLLLAAGIWWAQVGWWDLGLALIVLPAVSLLAALAANRAVARHGSMASARRAWSAAQVAAAVAVLVVVIGVGVAMTFVSPANGSGGLLVFLGLSMLIAAAAKYDGCEVLALPNLVLGGRDAIWCPVYSPIDRAEQEATW